MSNNNNKNFAILIDADNVPSKKVHLMIKEITKYGNPTFKRIYGDWTKPQLRPWKEVLLDNSIIPIQQYSYTTGKNATDSAMIIDAMDILYTGQVDGFCIISSDSDFTRLAARLREAGKEVIGMGEKKTNQAFISACDKFIYIEILQDDEDDNDEENTISTSKSRKDSMLKIDKRLERMITKTIDELSDDEGWVYLGDLGNRIIKKHPDFDPRNYGVNKLKPLLSRLKSLEIHEEATGNKNVKHVYVRVKLK